MFDYLDKAPPPNVLLHLHHLVFGVYELVEYLPVLLAGDPEAVKGKGAVPGGKIGN